jgi:hypothetical protein
MHARVEVADYAVKEKFKFQMRDGGQPLIKGALLSQAPHVGPIVEDEDRAVRKTWSEIAQAIERRLVNVAVDAHVCEFSGYLGIGALFSKKPLTSLIRGRAAH